MEKVKVVHLTSVHSPFDSRIFQKECKSLAQAGFEVFLVAPHGKREEVAGVTILPFEGEPRRTIRMTRTARQVVSLAARENAALYHLHDPELLPWCGLLKKNGGLVVFDMHEDLPHQIKNKRWVPRLFRPLLAWSARFSEKILLRNIPTIYAEKSYALTREWIRESVDILNFPRVGLLGQMKKMPSGGSRFNLGYIGTVTPERGSLVILEALAKVQTSGREVGFECIGKIPRSHQRELRDRMGDLNLKDVALVGYLPPEQGWKKMAGFDVGLAVLHPIANYLESYPTKIFEYMSMGIPAIVSDFPLYRKIIEKHQCGILVDPLDANSIAEAIMRLMDSPDEAAAMGERGRQAARSHYSWESEQVKLLGFYSRILQVS